MNKIKPIRLSKANWLNILVTIVGFLSMKEFNDVVPTAWLPFILVAVGAVNLIIRNFFTSRPTTEFAAERNS